MPNYSKYIGGVSTYNSRYVLQLGDALNSQDHVVLVTDLVYNSKGAITSIEITEQTPPQMKRSYYTPEALSAKYGRSYSIYNEIKNVKTGKCLDVNASSSSAGANVQVWDDYNNAAQSWNLYDVNGKYVLRPSCSSTVIQYHDSTSKAQQWKFVRQSDGSYMIQNVKYGKFLDVSGGSSKS